jgi:uncharacterized membrane protein
MKIRLEGRTASIGPRPGRDCAGQLAAASMVAVGCASISRAGNAGRRHRSGPVMQDTADLLHHLALFRDLPAEQLQPLRQSAIRRRHAEGETIFRCGDKPDYLYVVESGTIEIAVPAQAGEIVVASFEAGSFFGELAVFDRQPRSASARAVDESVLICIPVEAVAELIETHPPAVRRFVAAIALRLRNADELLSRLHVQNVNELADRKMGFAEKVADRVARFGGSWTFIISFGVFMLLWAGLNSVYLFRTPPDPFPYAFLNLLLACTSALQAPIIMMSQNRQAAKERLQADQEFRINVQAEIAVQQLHRKIDELRSTMLQHLHTLEQSAQR